MSLNTCKTYCYRKTIFNGNKSLFTRRKESEFAYRDLRAVIDWLLVPIRTRSWNAFTRNYVYFIYIFSSCICFSVNTTFVVITFKYPLLFLHRDQLLLFVFINIVIIALSLEIRESWSKGKNLKKRKYRINLFELIFCLFFSLLLLLFEKLVKRSFKLIKTHK